MSLRDAWNDHAEEWTRWARAPGHDSYWQFHRGRFLDLLPPPGRLTVDIGGGEGRVGRDLQALGHSVVSLDASPKMTSACARHPGAQPTVLADAEGSNPVLATPEAVSGRPSRQRAEAQRPNPARTTVPARLAPPSMS